MIYLTSIADCACAFPFFVFFARVGWILSGDWSFGGGSGGFFGRVGVGDCEGGGVGDSLLSRNCLLRGADPPVVIRPFRLVRAILRAWKCFLIENSYCWFGWLIGTAQSLPWTLWKNLDLTTTSFHFFQDQIDTGKIGLSVHDSFHFWYTFLCLFLVGENRPVIKKASCVPTISARRNLNWLRQDLDRGIRSICIEFGRFHHSKSSPKKVMTGVSRGFALHCIKEMKLLFSCRQTSGWLMYRTLCFSHWSRLAGSTEGESKSVSILKRIVHAFKNFATLICSADENHAQAGQ